MVTQGWSVLTPREAEVLSCILRLMSNGQIAAELGVSINTVRSHMRSLMLRTGTGSRYALAQWAKAHGY